MRRKADVGYRMGMGTTRCKTCRYFRPKVHFCLRVYGIINPEFWCKLFKRRIP